MFRSRLCSLLLALGLGTLASSPVNAWDAEWKHPINTLLHYYMPGPPGGDSYLTRCVVGTALEKWPTGDQAILKVYDNRGQGQIPSSCRLDDERSWVEVVTWDGTRLNVGPRARTKSNGSDTYSIGPRGQAILGAHFSAIVDSTLVRTWLVTVPL
jgi:Ni,Fe-hydrogenase I large subunit